MLLMKKNNKKKPAEELMLTFAISEHNSEMIMKLEKIIEKELNQ